jgi:hypothetical protein
MAVTGSAPISITDISDEFGGDLPHSLTEYYRGGSLVPDYPQNSGIPTSGAISLTQFYGASDVAPYADWSTTQTTGLRSSGKSWAERGYLAGVFGGMDDTTVDGQSGTTISAAYYRLGLDTASYLKLTLANGSDNWANFVVNGTTYSRGSASKSGTTWTWGNGTAGTGGVANPYPSVGAGDRISIAINV